MLAKNVVAFCLLALSLANSPILFLSHFSTGVMFCFLWDHHMLKTSCPLGLPWDSGPRLTTEMCGLVNWTTTVSLAIRRQPLMDYLHHSL